MRGKQDDNLSVADDPTEDQLEMADTSEVDAMSDDELLDSMPYAPSVDEELAEIATLGFEEYMLRRVIADFEAADKFMGEIHQDYLRFYSMFSNAQEYDSIREMKQFPYPMMQIHVDQWRAEALDKIFYSNRPTTVVPGEGTTEEEADAKQKMLDWQDKENRIRTLFSLAIRDCALARYTVAQVSYEERSFLKWRAVTIGDDGQPAGDDEGVQLAPVPFGQTPPTSADGKQWRLVVEKRFCGAWVERIAPTDFFITQDKMRVDDEFPIMIRHNHPLRYFYSKSYFKNQDQIMDGGGKPNAPESTDTATFQQKEFLPGDRNAAPSENDHETIKWQGMVDKESLYRYLGKDEMEMKTVRKKERCRAVCYVVDQKVVVRLEDSPIYSDQPNVVVGFMEAEGESLVGKSLAEKIQACHMAMQENMGILLENFLQSVNAMFVINTSQLKRQKQLINKAGAILETNGTASVRDVVHRVEQPRVAADIYTLFKMLTETSQKSDGFSDIIGGQGDPGANTLGESTMVFNQSILRVRDYIRSFETSFIEPLYELRDWINMLLIDESFAFNVVGTKTWKRMDPGDVRASVLFVCESATRESNRAVIIQQILQLGQILPLQNAFGQPARIDKMLAGLARTGFNWTEKRIEEIWPLLKMEREAGSSDQIDDMLVKNALLTQAVQIVQKMTALGQMQAAQMMAPGGDANGGGGAAPGRGPQSELPSPTTESDAIVSATNRNKPTVPAGAY